jgi:outer membrane protein assembly factor BamB
MADQIKIPGVFILDHRLPGSSVQEDSVISHGGKDADIYSPYSQAPARMYSVTGIPGASLLDLQGNQGGGSPHGIDITAAAGMVFSGNIVNEALELYQTGGEVRSSPCRGADGTIYAGSGDGNLYAYKNGKEIWRFETGKFISSSPCVDSNNIVYFGSFDRKIYAVQDGNEVWSISTGGEVRSSPILGPDGTLYVGSNDGLLYAIKDGKIMWTGNAKSAIQGPPALGKDGTVYTATEGGMVVAFDGKTGQPKWSYAPYRYDKFCGGPLVAPDDTVYIGSENGYFYAIKEGKEKWTFTPKFDRWNGRWSKDPINSTAVMDEEGVIYFGGGNRRLYALKDGGAGPQVLWDFETHGPINGSPALTDAGIIYIGSHDAMVYAVKDGEELTRYKSRDWVMTTPCVCPDGMVYFGSNDRRVYGVKGLHKATVRGTADDASSTGSSAVSVNGDVLTIQGVRLPINAAYRHLLATKPPNRRGRSGKKA